MLDGVAAVILDEIHAVAGSKRGTHLVTAVDRLVRLCGEFQRIALSATVKPLSAMADLVGGFTLDVGRPAASRCIASGRVQIVHCPMTKTYELRVAFPAADAAHAAGGAAPPRTAAGAGPGEEPVFDALARECRRIIAENRSTLFFVNSRRHAEKLARFINEGQPQPLAWSHHGSLSRELRLVVEQRLKQGELKAIVATSSLELGIDIGSLDQVILVQTPFTVASAVQRLGRAGHRVGEPSRGVLFPLHGKDIVDAAVTARCVREQDIDEIAPVICPLDVLAQVIVSMTSVETWKADELYDFIRAGFPFHDAAAPAVRPRAGHAGGPVRGDAAARPVAHALLRPHRVHACAQRRAPGSAWPRAAAPFPTAGTSACAPRTPRRSSASWTRSSSGSAPSGTPSSSARRAGGSRRSTTRTWRWCPWPPRLGMSPFWKAEERNRDFHFSERIAEALEEWNPRVTDARLPAELEESHGLAPAAARGDARLPRPPAGGHRRRSPSSSPPPGGAHAGPRRQGRGGERRPAHAVGRDGSTGRSASRSPPRGRSASGIDPR